MTLKIKICGLSSLEQIEMVRASGAEICGFVFANPSPRMIEPEYAVRNSFSKAASDIDRVAVFVNADDNYIDDNYLSGAREGDSVKYISSSKGSSLLN